jgi:hypothetical protein
LLLLNGFDVQFSISALQRSGPHGIYVEFDTLPVVLFSEFGTYPYA